MYEFVFRTLLPFLAVPPLEPIGHDVARVRDGEVGVVPVANMPVPRPHHQRDTYRRRRGPVNDKGRRADITGEVSTDRNDFLKSRCISATRE